MERVNPFADPTEAPVFKPKTTPHKAIEKESIEQIARDQNFPSRQAQRGKTETVRKSRRYTTGRNQQLNFKATSETVARFYRLADERKLPLCELFELALNALEDVKK